LGAWAQDAPYTVNGQLKNFTSTEGSVILYYQKDGKRVMDSAKVVDGKYSFTGTIDAPVQANILGEKPGRTRLAPKMVASLMLEPGNLTVVHTDSISNVTITGSPANTEFAKLNAKLKPFTEKNSAFEKEYMAARANQDQATMARIQEEAEAVDSTIKEDVYLGYFKSNPSSPIALFALQSSMSYDVDAEKYMPLYNKLSEKAKLSAAGKALKSTLDIALITGIGKPAPDFVQNDTLDNPVKLSSLRGKYVLVDFWASWCGPCRAENPNVVKAFNQYKDKGFTVLGVSLDQPGAKTKWLDAIHKDGLTWMQVSDLQGWNNAAAKSYGVRAIPQNFLVDPQGKIVGKNLRGEALDKKLAALLKG
jgi:peroxiredoxin